ncbi:amidase [Okibacterium endophyticum]
MSDLHYLSAADALRMFRSRELSPVELMTAVIERAQEVEPIVNALCHTFFDQALAAAREAEARYGRAGPPPRALEGIPLAVKEHEPIAGQPWTQASLLHRDEVATSTSCFAQRMIDAGAIVHARTTGPEYGAAVVTRSRLWGPTRNPWNPEYDVGGSSGGSGAALAAGTATLASGSDMGGSIRIPASFTGVVGYKPPYGRVPSEPTGNQDTYLHYGPMARTVVDTILLQNVIAGPDDSDITSLRPKLELPLRYEGAAGLRIALSLDFGGWAVDPEVRRNTLEVAEALRAAGATVDEVDLVLPRDDVNRAAGIHVSSLRLTDGSWDAFLAANADAVSNELLWTSSRHRKHGEGASIDDGWEIEARLYSALAGVFRSYDVLICPTVATRGLLADRDYPDDFSVEVDGQKLEGPFDAMMTMPFNIMSRCPALSVPSGFADNGVPTGLQIVGPTFDDAIVFRVGAAVEQLRPWFDAPERRPFNARAGVEA